MSSEDASSEQAKPGGSSSGGNPYTSPPEGASSISISILSPSAELPHQLVFPCVSIASTVGDLKRRIRDAVPSKPELERLRLIHRGRMLSRDTDTMLDVFGPTAIDDSSAKSLHLVLRPLVSDPSTSGPPNSSLGRRSPNPTLPRFTPAPHGQARGGALTEPLDHNLLEHNRGVLRTRPAGYGQMNNLPAPLAPEGTINGQPTPTFARYVTHQQQMRTSGEMAGLQPGAIPATGNPDWPNNHDASQTNHVAPEGPPSGQNPLTPGASGGFTRTHTGPHRWHTTVNYSTVTIPSVGHATARVGSTSRMGSTIPQNVGPGAIAGMPGIPGFHDLSALLAAAAAGQAAAISTQHGFPVFPGLPTAANQVPLNTAARSHSPQVSNELDLSLAQVNQLRDQINALRQRLSSRLGSSLPRSDNTSSSDEQLRSSVLRPTTTIRFPSPEDSSRSDTHTAPTASNTHSSINPSDQASILRTEPQGVNPNITTPLEFRRSPDPVAYILFSSSGPHALVVSPYGLYSSGVPRNHNVQRAVEHIHGNQQSNEPHLPDPERHRGVPQAAHQNNQRRPNLRARVAENGIPFVRLLQGLAPLGANIWLIARLIGFVVLFTGNSSWQRTILLALGATAVFLVQTGVLEPVIELVWGPVRRHIESVLLSADRRRTPDATRNAQNADAGDNEVEHTRPQEQLQRPEPENAAARLVREHQQRQRTWVFEVIRAMERAIILFIASLVPGIGERHIAELDAAQQMEQAANERRAEAETQEQIAAHVEAEGPDADNTDQGQGDGASGVGAVPEPDSGNRDQAADGLENAT
ncbi:hypothetical protein GP486_001313 [Trichoglossum hirsutum]|uniref:Ubiquitin-like domain-containing protein n=1 Tax=Trichoglossum hirsutum TaxID=265104 RepID=A0A9P8RT81_9PEZI|nr:hypothetical protein GP486_001313 [Trichoglossum hirsutum]